MLYNKPFRDIKLADLQMVVDTCEKNYPTLKKLKSLFSQLYAYAMKTDVCNKDYSEYVDILRYRSRAISKQQIVSKLEMGLSTVSQNLNELEQEGLIERSGHFDSTGGRKAKQIQIVADARMAIGVGILQNMVHIVAVNLYGEAIQASSFPVPYERKAAYYDEVTELIRRFIDENHYDSEKILGISIATQGIIAPDGSSVTYGSIMGNTEEKLSDFADRLPYPCRLEHDSAAAAYLELWNHPELESAAVVLLNRNLGGAVIANHEVHQGASRRSGAIEHMCIHPSGPMCYCGNHGCLETYCSVNALEQAAGMPITDFFTQLREEKHAALENVWRNYLSNLALAIKNFNLIVDSPIILSGYLAPYLTEGDIGYLLNQVNSFNPFPIERDMIVVGTHGQYTPAIGTALHDVTVFLSSMTEN